MSRKPVQYVFLCEDQQHAAFLRRFFKDRSKRPYVIPSMSNGRGAGEQWVRKQFPLELRKVRMDAVNRKLIVLFDADIADLSKKMELLNDECRKNDIPVRTEDDPVAVFIAKRNIETWITYLQGQAIDESTEYRKLLRPRDCKIAVQSLKDMCDAGQLREPAPPSLQAACEEYRRRLK